MLASLGMKTSIDRESFLECARKVQSLAGRSRSEHRGGGPARVPAPPRARPAPTCSREPRCSLAT